ncbi:hypothetical protein D9M70_404930 [compost metagenome]
MNGFLSQLGNQVLLVFLFGREFPSDRRCFKCRITALIKIDHTITKQMKLSKVNKLRSIQDVFVKVVDRIADVLIGIRIARITEPLAEVGGLIEKSLVMLFKRIDELEIFIDTGNDVLDRLVIASQKGVSADGVNQYRTCSNVVFVLTDLSPNVNQVFTERFQVQRDGVERAFQLLDQVGLHGRIVQHFHGDADFIRQGHASHRIATGKVAMFSTPVTVGLLCFQNFHHRTISHGHLLNAAFQNDSTVCNIRHFRDYRQSWSQRNL